MRTRKDFTFSGIIEEVRFNLVTTAVFLPHHLIVDLPKGRIKVRGIMNGVPFSSSVLYRRETGRYFSISAALRKAADLQPGDAVNVTFRIIDDRSVDAPELWETVLDENDKAKKGWKRSSINDVLSAYIQSAKQIDMRVRKAFERVGKSKVQPTHQTSIKKKNKKSS